MNFLTNSLIVSLLFSSNLLLANSQIPFLCLTETDYGSSPAFDIEVDSNNAQIKIHLYEEGAKEIQLTYEKSTNSQKVYLNDNYDEKGNDIRLMVPRNFDASISDIFFKATVLKEEFDSVGDLNVKVVKAECSGEM